ncbi:DUF1440 domain-containing protein [Terrimonas sp. NA20]|uniref:DUF1440 domain-containing protein n=1 Tax=Terrimonas ginsenosidimutans TaxID=2908004 RepID=A0ABS9KZK4_9BACT|nr:DUF1440 domain-containing protein [Terrimonas ginsenosidimutans]MCG2617819.1 DUF1440 domain-containing protein [Terrimonas ginsenosidimutans]
MPYQSKASAIFKAGLLAGTMDILAAFIKYSLEGKKDVTVILRYIATGVLGKEAMKGGPGIALFGLALHYFIAFVFTILLFLLYEKMRLTRYHPLLIGFMYGIFTWLAMNLVILPLSHVPGGRGPINWEQAVIGSLILIACIGFPVSLLARKYYLYKK